MLTLDPASERTVEALAPLTPDWTPAQFVESRTRLPDQVTDLAR